MYNIYLPEYLSMLACGSLYFSQPRDKHYIRKLISLLGIYIMAGSMCAVCVGGKGWWCGGHRKKGQKLYNTSELHDKRYIRNW